MSLTDAKVRSVINMLSDPGSAANAARVLAEEAKRRRILVADLIAEALAPPASAPPPPSFSDVDEDRIDVAVGKRINSAAYGLRTEILAETGRAWCVRSPDGAESWLPKSQCQHHGADAVGRAVLIVPAWLWKKKGFLS